MKNVINIIKKLWDNITCIPSAEELAVLELNEAKRQHLQMLTALDYSKRMVDYHQDRIKRLTAYIAVAKGVASDD
jgi:predicted NAD/FAD-binding protein